MKVLKFGGTSVGTPESLRNVRNIVISQPEPCIVTVSALGGITDKLLAVASMAVDNSPMDSIEQEISAIRTRHLHVIEEVVMPEFKAKVTEEVSALINEFEMIIKAVALLGELTERTSDLIVSYGERMSCLIVTGMFQQAALAHSLDFIRTHRSFGKNVLNQEQTSRLIAERFAPLGDARIIIVPGFISRNECGKISNLGRGGSDYTAAILAAELNAKVLEIWTDVDGFMSADPRRVDDARIIERLSFAEAMELCNFGAKVVYPPTIYPVFHKNIPIIIKNTFNPTAPGTLIAESCHGKPAGESDAIGVSAIADTALVELTGASKADYERMVNTLGKNGIEPLIPNGHSCCGVHEKNLERAKALLSEEFAHELVNGTIGGIKLTGDLSMLALICRDTCSKDSPTQFASALNLAGIPLVYGPLQPSPGTIAGMIPRVQLTKALNEIHNTFIQ